MAKTPMLSRTTTSPEALRANARPVAYDKARLSLVRVIALVTAGIAASIRGNLAAVLQHQFLDPIDPVHSAQMIGTVLGVTFFGFAITIMVGNPLGDYLGMWPLLALSSICFMVGTVIVICAAPLSHSSSAYWVLWAGTLGSGIGWGLAETVINPLAVTLYPDDSFVVFACPSSTVDRHTRSIPRTFISHLSFSGEPTMDTRQSLGRSLRPALPRPTPRG